MHFFLGIILLSMISTLIPLVAYCAVFIKVFTNLTKIYILTVYKDLQSTGCFEWMNLETDEDEVNYSV